MCFNPWYAELDGNNYLGLDVLLEEQEVPGSNPGGWNEFIDHHAGEIKLLSYFTAHLPCLHI